jgi:hypothetical protein
MSEDVFTAVIGDVLALLGALRAERVDTDEALSRLAGLKRRHPRCWFNMVWERESVGEAIHYDILVGAEGGTYSLSYCADEETPWAVRGTQRINESLVVRVDDDPVYIHQAITSLDHAWLTLHIGRHLIDTSLIGRELTSSSRRGSRRGGARPGWSGSGARRKRPSCPPSRCDLASRLSRADCPSPADRARGTADGRASCGPASRHAAAPSTVREDSRRNRPAWCGAAT